MLRGNLNLKVLPGVLLVVASKVVSSHRAPSKTLGSAMHEMYSSSFERFFKLNSRRGASS
jgi:hypothetical protein